MQQIVAIFVKFFSHIFFVCSFSISHKVKYHRSYPHTDHGNKTAAPAAATHTHTHAHKPFQIETKKKQRHIHRSTPRTNDVIMRHVDILCCWSNRRSSKKRNEFRSRRKKKHSSVVCLMSICKNKKTYLRYLNFSQFCYVVCFLFVFCDYYFFFSLLFSCCKKFVE